MTYIKTLLQDLSQATASRAEQRDICSKQKIYVGASTASTWCEEKQEDRGTLSSSL